MARFKSQTTSHTAGRRYVSPAEAADYLGVDIKTVRRRIADGRITAYRFGDRLLRIDLDEVDAGMRPVRSSGGVT